jgi:hypothetical protein
MSGIELNTAGYDGIYLEKFSKKIFDKDYFIRSANIAIVLDTFSIGSHTRFD